MNIQTVRQVIRQESPSRIMDGMVISSDPRGTRTATVRETGGHVHSRVYTCTEDIGVGDRVIVARLEGLDRLVILGKVASSQGSSLSNKGVLAPPANFSVLAYPAMVYAQWDTYPGEDLSWEIQYSTAGSPYSDAVQALVSRGSYYLHPCDPGTTIYMRARAVRWLGDNNLMYSAWTSWASVAAADHEVPNLIITLTNKSGGARIAGEVVIVDTGNADSFTTTTTEGDIGVTGIVMESIADDAAGLVCICGYCEVLVDEAVAIGEYLEASTTEGQAEGEAARAAGTFARALTAAANPGEKVWAIITLGMVAGGGHTPAPANEGEGLVADATLAWVASLTPTWLGTHTWGTGFNLMPTDATGQALGDATHRWDLHTQTICFEGAADNNTVTVPDNIAIALKVLDAGGLEYMRINSENANPYLLIDPAGAGIKIGVGITDPAWTLDIRGNSFTPPVASVALFNFGHGQFVLTDMSIGAGESSHGFIGQPSTVLTGAATSVTGGYFWAGVTSVGAETVTSLYGVQIGLAKDGGAIVTTAYGIYIKDIDEGATNYSIYSVGGTFYHGGSVGIGVTPAAKIDVYETTALGAVAGDRQIISRVRGDTTNVVMKSLWGFRDNHGADWTTYRLHDGISVDGNFLIPGTDTKVWWERDPSNNIQSWGNAASTYLTINAGKVGILTTVPVRELHVGNGADATFQAYVGITANVAGIAQVSARNSTNNVEVGMFAHTSAGYIGVWTNHTLGIRTNNTSRIVISAAGAVKINSLAGAGDRAVIAAPDGTLSAP